MSWRTMEVQDQRVRFVIAASRGEQNMSELCREFDISRPTGYQWLRRYRTAGVAGIREERRRPRRSPRRTVSAIEQRIAELRGGRPDWGSTEAGVPAGARRDSGSPSDGSSRVAAPGTGAIGRSALSGELTVPARAAQSTLANGFQESQGLGQQDWTTVVAGRRDALCGGVREHRQHP